MTRKGDWVMTYSGIEFWPLDPRPEEIEINDIAHSLAMSCRWTGHVSKFYSVAEHSVHVSHLVPEEHALQALLHDASEAYISDIARPVKPLLANYYEVEDVLQRAIYDRFGVACDMHPTVKEADDAMLTLEGCTLMSRPERMHLPWKPAERALICMDWQTAKAVFLNRFEELTK